MIPIPAFNPTPLTGAGNVTYLLDGAEPTLIDAGVGKPEHLAALEHALGGRPLARVLLTHGHADHVLGLPAILERWPGVGVWRFGHENDPAGLRSIHTPGHAHDHVCFWDEAAGDLFSGDMIVAGGTVMVPPARKGGSLGDYLASLEAMLALGPRRLLPAHGPIIDDPAAEIRRYLDHRRQRDEQIRACLADGLDALDLIVARVYPDLPEALRPAAALTVEAHLERLRSLS